MASTIVPAKSDELAAELAVTPSLDAISGPIATHCLQFAVLKSSFLQHPSKITDHLFDALAETYWQWPQRFATCTANGTTIDAAFTIDAKHVAALTTAATDFATAYEELVRACGERLVQSTAVLRFEAGLALAESKLAKPSKKVVFLRALDDWACLHDIPHHGTISNGASYEFNEALFRDDCRRSIHRAFNARLASSAPEATIQGLWTFEIESREWPLKKSEFVNLRAKFSALSEAFQTLLQATCDEFVHSVLAQIPMVAKRQRRV